MIEKYFHFLGGSRNIHHIIFIQDTSEGKAFLAPAPAPGPQYTTTHNKVLKGGMTA